MFKIQDRGKISSECIILEKTNTEAFKKEKKKKPLVGAFLVAQL